MLVKITLSGILDTEQQDKFLKQAIENLITGGDGIHDTLESDSNLVTKTMRSRFCSANLGVQLIKR